MFISQVFLFIVSQSPIYFYMITLKGGYESEDAYQNAELVFMDIQ